MGVGLLYRDLVKMEGARVTLKLGNKKRSVTGMIKSANLHKEGLFIMLDLGNGKWRLLGPEDKAHDIEFTPQPTEKQASIESLAGDGGPF